MSLKSIAMKLINLPVKSMSLRLAALSAVAVALGGCESIGYYAQAAHGQWQLLSSRQPVGDLLASPQTDPALKQRLELINEVRDFAREKIDLPVGENFATYVDVGRPYVIWNVFAAPELSIKPMTWCYPIAGCVSYRGYFAESAANDKARQLSEQGYDVYVGGVRAFSTLGWFDDSILSTYAMQSEASLAGLIFHELAHQVVYVEDDTAFNESFAQSVEQLALQQYFGSRAADPTRARAFATYMANQSREQAFTTMLLKARTSLHDVYSSGKDDAERRAGKQRVLAQLAVDYEQLKLQWNGDARYDQWMKTVNNAKLATIADYHQWTGAFRNLRRQNSTWQQFYEAAKALAALTKDERQQRLRHLALEAETQQQL
jgi:predicted aminopeptidase